MGRKAGNILGKEYISGSDYSESKLKFKLKLQRQEQLNEEHKKVERKKTEVKNQVNNKVASRTPPKPADQEKKDEHKKRNNLPAVIEKADQKPAASKKRRGNELENPPSEKREQVKQLRAYMPIVPDMGDLKKSPYFSKFKREY
ncbi:hypothetical protein MKX03_031497, partial [Papaver bracteatum]